jgi:hypothetical protein
MIDLFETPELLPTKVKALINRLTDSPTYKSNEALLKRLKPLGYTFDYYLDAIPYNLRKISL